MKDDRCPIQIWKGGSNKTIMVPKTDALIVRKCKNVHGTNARKDQVEVEDIKTEHIERADYSRTVGNRKTKRGADDSKDVQSIERTMLRKRIVR